MTPRRRWSRRRSATPSPRRRGVCQDFAHIMIAGLRGVGLPARYVSGYLRTVPPPGQQRLEGADATHAWVAFWCGKDRRLGRPRSHQQDLCRRRHIVLAEGRDYAESADRGRDPVVGRAGRVCGCGRDPRCCRRRAADVQVSVTCSPAAPRSMPAARCRVKLRAGRPWSAWS